MEKIILAILGVFVVERKSEIKDPKSIAVANNVSRFDHVAVSALCNYTSVSKIFSHNCRTVEFPILLFRLTSVFQPSH